MGTDHNSIVFVVGAGASVEFGLPTGKGLLEELARLGYIGHHSNGNLYGDRLLHDTFSDISTIDSNVAIQSAQVIGKNAPIAPSIDNFLHTRSTDVNLVTVGKIMIARAILEAERKSTLFYDRRNSSEIEFAQGRRAKPGQIKDWDVKPPSQSWLNELFRLLVAERDLLGFVAALRKISFISFNYDRCIEHFLLHAAQQYFSLGSDEVHMVASALNVIYPYGSLGPLFQRELISNTFGKEVDYRELPEVSQNIRTFTEGTDVSVTHLFSRNARLFFLGFGFLPLNMELLYGREKHEIDGIFCTAKGLPSESPPMIESELRNKFLKRRDETSKTALSGHDIAIRDCTASELIFNFSRSISTWLR